MAPNARRCPNCNAKRPAATVANAVWALAGVVVMVVVLIALVAGHGGGRSSKSASAAVAATAISRVQSEDGGCLSQAGVPMEGATVTDHGSSQTVTLIDGSQFTVRPDGSVVTANPQADHDILSGSVDC